MIAAVAYDFSCFDKQERLVKMLSHCCTKKNYEQQTVRNRLAFGKKEARV